MSDEPRDRAALLADFGPEPLSVQSFFQFSYVPAGRQTFLRESALPEDWGENQFVLYKYLAVHVRLAIEQGRYLWNGDQLVLSAGRLHTADGAPLYLGFVRNNTPDENPWVLNWVGERPSCAGLPAAPDLGPWPTLDPGCEVVVVCDLEGVEPLLEACGLAGLDPVTQRAALAGAAAWSLHRGLAQRQLHGDARQYFVPLYFTSRADLAGEPDAVAPLFVRGDELVVRTVLEAPAAYAPARVCVERADQLAPWLRRTWEGDGGDAGRPDGDAANR